MRDRTRTAGLVAFTALITTALPGAVHAAPSGGALPPELIQIVDVTAVEGVPADVTMVALNVTAVAPAEPGFLTVFACDEQQPTTSNVNYLADQVVPNLVMARVADDGTVCIATQAVSDVLVDLVGYVPAGSAVQPLAAPVRVIDTRQTATTPRAAGSVVEIPIAGQHGVDADAEVVMFNATAVAGTQPGYLTAYPCDGAVPPSSSVNYLPNQIVANMVTSRIGANGSICIFTLAPADIVVDIAAYATDGITPLSQPVRLADTRTSGARVSANGTLTIDVSARADVPDDATAAAYNLTAVNPGAAGFVTSYPCDAPRPGASNLNYRAGQIVANGAITKLSASGQLCLYSLAASDLIVDLVGFTQGTTDYQPITPTRLLDTRDGWQSQCDWVLRGFEGNNSLNLVNVVTGERRNLPNPTPIGSITGAPPIVARTCDHVVWYVSQGRPYSELGLYRGGLDGSLTQMGSHPASFAPTTDIRLHQLADGTTVGVRDDGPVYDMTTGAVVYTPPFASPTIDTAISANGYLARLVGEWAEPTTLEVFDMSTDELISSTELPEYAYTVSVGPDGTYVAVVVAGDPNDFFDDGVVILTQFGAPVDAYFDIPQTHPQFVGNGQLVLCVATRTVLLWSLFSPVHDLGVPCG